MQLKKRARISHYFILTWFGALAVLAFMLLKKLDGSVTFAFMTRDVTAQTHAHPFTAIISNLGILLWGAAAAISLFSAFLIRAQQPKIHFWFLLTAGVLSAWLCFDDGLLFHEYLAMSYFRMDENIVFAITGVLLLNHLFFFRQVILQTDYSLLVCALFFFVLSIAFDVVFPAFNESLGDWGFFLEDGAKWLSIAFWFSFHARAAYQLVTRNFASERDQALP